MKPQYLLIVATALVSASCATKGPKKVTASPLVIPQQKGVTDWAVESAPRTQPGKVMDPQAVTYAQVPKRILFMPGEDGIFGRTSAQQQVAYDLVPVDRIPEVQAKGTPAFQPNTSNTPKWSGATFTDSTGNLRKGKARRLGVINKTVAERNRAEGLLAKTETLEWMEGTGWVGFTETEYIRIDNKPKSVPPPPIPEPDPVKPIKPVIEKPAVPTPRPKVEEDDNKTWGLDKGLEPLDGL